MATSWIPVADDLSPAALTVRAQAISPNDNGMLKWDAFFPRENVDSVELEDVTTLDDRPTADRREWNGRGRNVPLRAPARRKVSIVPVEAYSKIDEYEMQRLNERTLGNEALIQQIMQAQIPARVDRLTRAVYRRIEVDAFKAWALGTLVQKNPQTGETYTASFGFDAARFLTAGTAWNDAGVNAYDLYIQFMRDAEEAIGPTAGSLMRIATRNAILADAPDLAGGGTMTLAQLEMRIQDDLGSAHQLITMESTVDVFTDGGTATTSTKVWEAQRVAAIPAGLQVGKTAFAPVVRAMELARSLPGAGIDMNGVTVYYEESNGGRELEIDVQANPATIPDEQKLYVTNAGV